jgi:hypothetical protein
MHSIARLGWLACVPMKCRNNNNELLTKINMIPYKLIP